jgi:hypothetical protein
MLIGVAGECIVSRILVSSVIALVLAGPGAADSPKITFEKVTSAAGRFAADMPGQPAETTEKLPSGTLHSFAVMAAGPSVFRIKYIDFPEGEVTKKNDPQGSLKAFRSGFREGKTFEGDKEISLGTEKIPGREYRLEADKGVFVRERLYVTGDRLYIVHVGSLNNKDFLGSDAANRFFDSFKITK